MTSIEELVEQAYEEYRNTLNMVSKFEDMTNLCKNAWIQAVSKVVELNEGRPGWSYGKKYHIWTYRDCDDQTIGTVGNISMNVWDFVFYVNGNLELTGFTNSLKESKKFIEKLANNYDIQNQ